MKKSTVVWIVIASVCAIAFVSAVLPTLFLISGIVWEGISGDTAKIAIDSYRLCEDEDGEDIIIIKYLLKNEGNYPTALLYEGDFYIYQDGISLSEYLEELPKDCDYDPEDQYREIKGGVSYYVEIAYSLEFPDKDVEVEVDDYGLFDKKQEKVFSIKQ